jgi:cytochrome c
MAERMITALALIGLAAPLAAQTLPGDPRAGEKVARQICSPCHAVAPGELPPDPFIPTFGEAVDHPSVSALSLRAFLQTPHATMPDIRLTAEETDDLVSYLLTLR